MALADIKSRIKADSQAQIQAIESENSAKIREITQSVNAEKRPTAIIFLKLIRKTPFLILITGFYHRGYDDIMSTKKALQFFRKASCCLLQSGNYFVPHL